MRCHACGRPLTRAAYTHPSGWTLGPICAEKPENLPAEIRRELRKDFKIRPPMAVGKKCQRSAPKKQVKKIKQFALDEGQFDLFSG